MDTENNTGPRRQFSHDTGMYYNISICICVCVFCKQTSRKAGEDQICILLLLYFKNMKKLNKLFAFNIGFPKALTKNPHFAKYPIYCAF